MHRVVEIEKPSVEEAHKQKKPVEEGAAESVEEKWLGRSLVLIRWVVRGILIRAWASFLHHNFKQLAPSWATLSASFIFFSLLLYACCLLYLRFARHALASVSFNRTFALFNLLLALVLLLAGLAFSYLGLFAAEDASMFFYPHAVIAQLFIHLLTRRPSAARQRLSAKEPPPKRAACSTICLLFLQIFLLVLWILYPIARIHDFHHLKSPYILTLFILSTLVVTVSFIVFFCSAIALVFLGLEEFPTLL